MTPCHHAITTPKVRFAATVGEQPQVKAALV
jgi:hypothetical protein